MPDDSEFTPWLGHIRRDRSIAGDLRRATNLARGGARVARGRSSFTGARIGRGAGVGCLLGSSDRFAHARARRVVVKTRIVKLSGKGAARAMAHLRYLQRDGTTREGERGTLYAADRDIADGKRFLERASSDRHQFRFIVAAEDGAEYDGLKSLVRRLMAQAERDLATSLDWVAVDHFNTGHPHSHILLRGKDEWGDDLIIARDYLIQGLRGRAAEIVNLDLGPRSDREIDLSRSREIAAERYTDIDRRLGDAIDADGLVSPIHRDGVEQATRAGRLQTLARIGLASEERRGRWRLDPVLETKLKAMAHRGDIIATMHHEMGRQNRSRNSADYAIHEPGSLESVTGRVLASSLSDELGDRRYLIVEGVDGLAHHIDVGQLDNLPARSSIVRIEPVQTGVRTSDVTIVEVAAGNGGVYTIDAHLSHDRAATQTFAEAHVRRLEAIRRATDGVVRQPSGSWSIPADYLNHVADYERARAFERPVKIAILSTRSLDALPQHDGATWLDRELTAETPLKLERGFGEEVRRALQLRRQWLLEQGIVTGGGPDAYYDARLVSILERRELARTGAQLSRDLGLAFTSARYGDEINGIVRQPVMVGDAKFALIEKSREFSLVPWRDVHERALGKQISGIMRESGSISWSIGRSRGLEIG